MASTIHTAFPYARVVARRAAVADVADAGADGACARRPHARRQLFRHEPRRRVRAQRSRPRRGADFICRLFT